MKQTEFSKKCPNCNNTIYFTNKNSLYVSIKNNSMCGKCRLSGERNPFYGKSHTKESLKKQQKAKFGKLNPAYGRVGELHPMFGKSHSEETKNKMSEKQRGELHPMFGKSHSEETKNKIRDNQPKLYGKFHWNYGRTHSEEAKQKISQKANERKTFGSRNAFYGKSHSEEVRCKLRKYHINRISEAHFNGNQMMPNYNPSSIPIIEEKARELGITDLQHAENGGEFYIKELGYWVDGYSAKKNIVLEYDEKYHNKPSQKLKDKIREKEIKDYLNCKFIRIIGK